MKNSRVFTLRHHPELVLGSCHSIKGFTLIELLVVILISGILAAVAVPQYKKAVEKSMVAQVLPLLKTLASAQQIYFLEHGEYANSFRDLLVDLPGFTQNTLFNNYTPCSRDTRANEDWSFQIQNCDQFDIHRILVGRISGPYQGAAWSIELNKNNGLLCVMQTGQGFKYDWERARGVNYCYRLGFTKQVMTGVWDAFVQP